MQSRTLPGGAESRIKSHIDSIVAWLLLAVLAFAAFIGSAGAATPFVTPNDMTSGSLLLKSREGKYLEAPRLGADYTVTISGPTGRTIITQRFTNPANGWVEGVYVFPLPESAAVDTLKIVAGNRVIVGEVKEKQEAKVIYEQAKAAGQTASLLEQERPNIFTNSVANIGPHETVVVQIEYQETIHQSNGTYSLRVPLVVAPRYNPAPLVQTVDFGSNGYGSTVNDPVPDRDRISPPVLDPRKNEPVNPVTISVDLSAGFALADVTSHHHTVKIDTIDDSHRKLALDGAEIPADRDFELTWTAKGTAPQVGLFRETVQGKDYLLATVTPPSVAAVGPVKPRETVFVIDNSGSMDGPSMQQAKDALLQGLDTLKPQDRFNVVRFDDTFDVLFRDAVPANAEYLNQARAFVSALQANGGTEMVPALKAALIDGNANDAGTLRQVVFITDGAIGNEQELFATIGQGRGRSRIFMVGIGSAPNTYLMTRAAEMGRGTFTLISEVDQVKSRMEELFTKIGQPVVTGLAATIDGSATALTPSQLPDLYRGEPVLMMAEAPSLKGTLKVDGMIGDTPWSVSLPVSAAAQGKGISKLWAHRKVAEIETAATLNQITMEDANRQVLAVALTHQIVSSQTSLIAVDKSPKRPANQPLTRAEVPLNLPAGWNFEKVFGKDIPLPAPQSPKERDAMADAYVQLAVAEAPVSASAPQQVALPQTATPAGLLAILGGLMALLALAFHLLARAMTPKAA
ncbi:MAG: marine proteobacterial sortase target protein [Rhizobiales bacterium]|nr:marine proteobacterial sortase target protein [Hyphomicrobiales bacterium]